MDFGEFESIKMFHEPADRPRWISRTTSRYPETRKVWRMRRKYGLKHRKLRFQRPRSGAMKRTRRRAPPEDPSLKDEQAKRLAMLLCACLLTAQELQVTEVSQLSTLRRGEGLQKDVRRHSPRQQGSETVTSDRNRTEMPTTSGRL